MERGSQDGMESVGHFQMCVTIDSAAPDSEQRWARRADALTAWLVAEWHRKQAHDDGTVIDGEGRSNEAGDIRKCELN